MSQPPVLDYQTHQTSAAERTTWPLKWVGCALLLIFMAQIVFLPCLCEKGERKMNAGLAVDGLLLLRMAIAWRWNQKNRDWIFYLFLAASSVVWIPLAAGD